MKDFGFQKVNPEVIKMIESMVKEIKESSSNGFSSEKQVKMQRKIIEKVIGLSG